MRYTVSHRDLHRKGKSQLQFSSEWDLGFSAQWPDAAACATPPVRRTLWDIALRSIGHDVPLPSPFAPRKLTWKERLTGELEE